MFISALENIVILSLAITSHVISESDSSTSTCSPCHCEASGGRLKADCSQRNLKSIPLGLPETIVDIDLAGNGILEFNNDSGLCETYKGLKKISLANNELKEVRMAFKGCEAVEELDLTDSPLTASSLEKAAANLPGLESLKGLAVSGSLERGIFSPLRKLKYLELSYNGRAFPTDLFADLVDLRSLHLRLINSGIDDGPLQTQALRELYLYGQKNDSASLNDSGDNLFINLLGRLFQSDMITKLAASFYSNLGTLTTLDLELPQVNTLELPTQPPLFSGLQHLSIRSVWQVGAKTLSGMTSLKTLQLAGDIELVDDPDMFRDQQELEVLEITGCELKTLPSSWLSKLGALCDLNLINNKMRSLHPDALVGLSNLRNMDLSLNRIETIPEGFLNPVVDKLENLTLHGNMLTRVRREDFPFMKNLMALDVSGNKLQEFDLNISQQMPGLIYLQFQQNAIHNLTGFLGPKTQRVNASYNFFEYVPNGLLVESLIDLDLSGNPVALPVDELMHHDSLKELTIGAIVVPCDCALQRLIKSKMVHGGRCESGEGGMGGRAVGDILNELLCEDTIPTAAVVTIPTTSDSVAPLHLMNATAISHLETEGALINSSTVYPREGMDGDGREKESSLDEKKDYHQIHVNGTATIDGRTNSTFSMKKQGDFGKGQEEKNDDPYDVLVDATDATPSIVVEVIDPPQIAAKDPAQTLSPTNNTTSGISNTDVEMATLSGTSNSNGNTTSWTQVPIINQTSSSSREQQQNETSVAIDSVKAPSTLSNASSQSPANSSSSSSNKDRVQGGVGVGSPSSQDEENLYMLVFPIVSLLVVGLVVVVVLVVWHMRRTGSHSLLRDRRNIANDDDESETCKMVMTELGNAPFGHEVVVM